MAERSPVPAMAAFITAPADEPVRAYGELIYRRCWELGLRNIRAAELDDLDAALEQSGCVVLTEAACARLTAGGAIRLAEWVERGGYLALSGPPGRLADLVGLVASDANVARAEPGEGLRFEPLRATPIDGPPRVYPIWGEALLTRTASGREVLEFRDHGGAPAILERQIGRGWALSYLFTLGYTVFRNQSGRGIEHLSPRDDRQRANLPAGSAWMWDWCDDSVRYPTQSLAHPDWWQHPFSDGLLWPLIRFIVEGTGAPPLVHWVPAGRQTAFINTADSDSATDQMLRDYALEMQQRGIAASIFLQADQPHNISGFEGVDRRLVRFGIHHSPCEIPIAEQFRRLAEGGFSPLSSRGHGLQWHGVDTTAAQLRAWGVRIDSTHGLCGNLGASWYFFVDGTTAPHGLARADGSALDLLEVTVPFLCYFGQDCRPGEAFDLETYLDAYKRYHLVAAGAYHPVWNYREPRWTPMLQAMDRLSRDPQVWLTSMEEYLAWWDLRHEASAFPDGDRWTLAGPSVPGLTLLRPGAETPDHTIELFGERWAAEQASA